MLQSTERNFVCAPAASSVAPAAGLALLGLTTGLFGLHVAGLFPFGAEALALGLLYGAAGQIGCGMLAWRRQNPYASVLCIAFGLFWLSQLAMVALPAAGIGQAPQASAASSYLAMWGLFTTILFTGAARYGRELQIVLAAMGLFLLLLSAGTALGTPVLPAAGGMGIACGLAAVYTGTVRLLQLGRGQNARRP